MSRDNGLPGYDNWLTRELDLDGNEPPEVAVFTESDVSRLVEEMRAKCEAIAREESTLQRRKYISSDEISYISCSQMADRIAEAIASLRRP